MKTEKEAMIEIIGSISKKLYTMTDELKALLEIIENGK